MRLKPKEPGIWKEKLSRTVKDVTKFLGEKTTPTSTHSTSTVKCKSASGVGTAFDISSKTEKNKKVVKKAEITRSAGNVKSESEQKCICYTIMSDYMNKIDSALLMISTVLHLVRNEQTKSKDHHAAKLDLLEENVKDDLEFFDACTEIPTVKGELHEVSAYENVAKVAMVMSEACTEVKFDNATIEKSEAPSNEKNADDAPTPVVEQDVNAYGIKVTWAVCPQLRHRPVSECRRRCEWDVIARRAAEPSYNLVKAAVQPVDKDSEEYKQRVKNASNNFLAASGVLNKICPRGVHVGYAISDCKCDKKLSHPKCPHGK